MSRKTIPNLANLQKVIESRDHQLFEAAGSNYISEPPRCRATRLPRILKRLSEKFAPLRGTAGQVVSIIPPPSPPPTTTATTTATQKCLVGDSQNP